MSSSARWSGPESRSVAKAMRSNTRPTKPEMALRSALHRRGLRFRKSLGIDLPNRWTQPDATFTRLRVAVFLDGCFWHRCPEHGTLPRSNAELWAEKFERTLRAIVTPTRSWKRLLGAWSVAGSMSRATSWLIASSKRSPRRAPSCKRVPWPKRPEFRAARSRQLDTRPLGSRGRYVRLALGAAPASTRIADRADSAAHPLR